MFERLCYYLIKGLTTTAEVLSIGKLGSPNGSIHRTFRATFDMPVAPFNHSLIKVDKRQYRNPIWLARGWRRALDDGDYTSAAAIARHLKVSRTRVTQLLNLLKLTPEVIEMIFSLGDPLRHPIVTERKLRPLHIKQQTEQVKIMLFNVMHDQT